MSSLVLGPTMFLESDTSPGQVLEAIKRKQSPNGGGGTMSDGR